MSLEILACAACGGQVPLGDGDAVPCPFCGAQVPVPPAHRELRDAERRDASARTQASTLFERYGQPPSLLLRACAIAFNPWFLLFDGLFLMLGLSMLAVLMVGNLLSPLLHANLWDTLPDAPKGYGVFFVAAGSVLAGIALGEYGRRHVLSRRTLQAALAARPPGRPGESARCRSCGAPLAVASGALGVRCAYCRADNLVAVPASWIQGVVADAARVGREIEQAEAWLRDEQARFQRALRKHLLLSGGALLVFIGAIAASNPQPTWRTNWVEYVKAPRQLVRVPAPGRHWEGRPELPLGATCQPGAVQLAPADCAGGSCRAWLYVALREGEHLSLGSAAPAEGARVRVTQHSHFWWSQGPGPDLGDLMAEGSLGEAAFTAPWSAWYQLRVDFPGGPGPRPLCAVLGP